MRPLNHARGEDLKFYSAYEFWRYWRCAERKKGITWSQALDTPKHAGFQKKPYVKADKKRWLTYHDKNCTKLWGMLPLVKGMPVALVDHLDRSPEKQLLRGRVGTIGSWVEHDKEKSMCL